MPAGEGPSPLANQREAYTPEMPLPTPQECAQSGLSQDLLVTRSKSFHHLSVAMGTRQALLWTP